jgi:hypothetical protein
MAADVNGSLVVLGRPIDAPTNAIRLAERSPRFSEEPSAFIQEAAALFEQVSTLHERNPNRWRPSLAHACRIHA